MQAKKDRKNLARQFLKALFFTDIRERFQEGIKGNFFPAFTTLDRHLGTGVIWVKTWSYKMLKMSV